VSVSASSSSPRLPLPIIKVTYCRVRERKRGGLGVPFLVLSFNALIYGRYEEKANQQCTKNHRTRLRCFCSFGGFHAYLPSCERATSRTVCRAKCHKRRPVYRRSNDIVTSRDVCHISTCPWMRSRSFGGRNITKGKRTR
jgi:hypothetical protein